MSFFFDRVWVVAAETFSKGRGHGLGLSPFGRTWYAILGRAEHALWLWNDKYGPLTAAQRVYAGDLVIHALVKARKAPDVGGTYAFFNTTLTGLLNHEKVDIGFKSRADTRDLLGDVVGSSERVAA